MLLSLAGGKTGVFGHLPPEQLPVPSGERKGLS